MRHRNSLWLHVLRVSNAARYAYNHCAVELGSHPMNLKECMLVDACTSPIELGNIFHSKLVTGRKKVFMTAAAHERGDKHRDATVDILAVDDDDSGVGVGTDASLPGVDGVAEMLAVELVEDDEVVREWGGDAGAAAG